MRLRCRSNLATSLVVESLRRLQLPVRDFFSTILPELAGLPTRCLPDLTPALWGWGDIHEPKRRGRGVTVLLRQQSNSFVLADDTPRIDVPRASATRDLHGILRQPLTFGESDQCLEGARLVRFQGSKRTEWRAMLRQKKTEGAGVSPPF